MTWEVSDSHMNDYLNACRSFVNDEVLFSNFKQNSAYRVILEHVDHQEADQYQRMTKNMGNISVELITNLKENDLYGNPEIINSTFYGKISPTTIRYIKNTMDILDAFGNLNLKKIVEIGGGYGGLAKTISCLLDYNSYTIIDHEDVNALSSKYLSNFDQLKGKINHQDCMNIVEIKNIDLLISNYALSELSFDGQMEYYNKIIKNSERTYIIYNNFVNNYFERFVSVMEKDFTLTIEPELRGCKIIYGSKK